MTKKMVNLFIAFALLVMTCGCQISTSSFRTTSTLQAQPSSTPELQRKNDIPEDPAALINSERLYSFLEDLTSIRPYAGWRNSATQGEAEAVQYISNQLSSMSALKAQGLELIEDHFRVFIATQIHGNSLILQSEKGELQIPVNALRGSRDSIQSALRLDSDGKINDLESNPVTASGEVSLILDAETLEALQTDSLHGKIAFVDYSLMDWVLTQNPKEELLKVVNASPSGIVLVTSYSNEPGISHGTFAADLGPVARLETEKSIPTLLMRLEDLSQSTEEAWKTLKQTKTASMTWDTDVQSPGESRNLIAHIKGYDSSRAVLLSAHVDSANTPGALDDGSGSAILMEIAAVLNENKIIPNYDLYLVWYGSEELGLLGSANFTASHQEIVDKLVGMINIDCLSRPVEGAPATLNFAYATDTSGSNYDDPWVNYLTERAAKIGVSVQNIYMPLASDNNSFAGYNVANLDLIYDSESMMNYYNGVWFAGHLHDPYDEVKLVRGVDDQFQQMAQIALMAAFLPADLPVFRTKSDDAPRVVFIASHTEDVLMTPAGLFDLGFAFEEAGMDVDTIPYGQPVTKEQLENAAIVIALPITDRPLEDENAAYDESWEPSEIEVLKEYVKDGGMLIVTNSSLCLKFFDTSDGVNEDWPAMNQLLEEFGMKYGQGSSSVSPNLKIHPSPLTKDMDELNMFLSSIPLEVTDGDVLIEDNTVITMASSEYGKGTVVALGGLAALSSIGDGLLNPQLVQNIIAYAK